MTLLVDWQIKKFMEAGAIIIEPFNEDQLSDNAYDLTVSRHFWKYPSRPPLRSSPSPHQGFRYIDLGEKGSITVLSGERVLGASRERAGGRVSAQKQTKVSTWAIGAPPTTVRKHITVTTQLQATSTAARLGWQACACAGFGNVGFTKPWTFEITNCAPYVQYLPVGAIIAQVAFTEVEVPEKVYGKDHGQYQHEGDDWVPEMMLPGPLKVRD